MIRIGIMSVGNELQTRSSQASIGHDPKRSIMCAVAKVAIGLRKVQSHGQFSASLVLRIFTDSLMARFATIFAWDSRNQENGVGNPMISLWITVHFGLSNAFENIWIDSLICDLKAVAS